MLCPSAMSRDSLSLISGFSVRGLSALLSFAALVVARARLEGAGSGLVALLVLTAPVVGLIGRRAADHLILSGRATFRSFSATPKGVAWLLLVGISYAGYAVAVHSQTAPPVAVAGAFVVAYLLSGLGPVAGSILKRRGLPTYGLCLDQLPWALVLVASVGVADSGAEVVRMLPLLGAPVLLGVAVILLRAREATTPSISSTGWEGGWVVLASVAATSLGAVEAVVLERAGFVEQLSGFAISARLASGLLLVQSAISAVYVPRISQERLGDNASGDLRGPFLQACRSAVLLGGIGAFAIVAISMTPIWGAVAGGTERWLLVLLVGALVELSTGPSRYLL